MTIENGQFWQKAWNPVHVKGGGWHCTKISQGCRGCWSEAINKRFGNGVSFSNQQVEFELDQRILEQPLHWKKPRVIAVQWLGDLFHEQIPDIFIKNVVFASEAFSWHKYLFLTKRIERLKSIFDELYSEDVRPYDNVWLGVSICTQQEADEKIPILLKTPAAHRFVNLEPCLESIQILKWLIPGADGLPEEIEKYHDWVDWVLLGCESGPGRRPMKLEWARNIAEQCKAVGVPLWIKQLELEDWAKSIYKAKTKVSKNMADWPEGLKIRQWPWEKKKGDKI